MLRSHCNTEELEAHRTLDLVKYGFDAPQDQVKRALFVLGDGVGLFHRKIDMQPHQIRVVEEHTELEQKVERLGAFIGTPTYHALNNAEQYLLRRQLLAMSEYLDILAARIAHFKVGAGHD